MIQDSPEGSTAIAEPAEPPEVKLTAPDLSESEATWFVVAKNRKVNRDWEAMMLKSPENANRCYEHLCTHPNARQPGRVFPLKGKKYKGVWEYELTGGDRVFYLLLESEKKVRVYYAGKHPKPAPTP
ncbi:MAG: hypothetical protein KME18_18230 [Phormidium tanganyikae FI6-MK23]|jgi:hypothetical protein|nr:hypothetical protein [Phormidium tanganyikae FI6-MK23]